MLYKPECSKYRTTTMQEALIPMGRPAPSPPPEPRAPSPTQAAVPEYQELEEEEMKRLPMLISSYKIVVPAEATKDVLSGRVPYILVEDEGVTIFKPVHMFAALKLKKETIEHLEDYKCIGAHERFLEKRPKKRVGLGYRRKYISPELIGRGIFRNTIVFD
ncbi:uncharacterized protein LOC130443724 isoform X2 [Diorhabda sublineata]|uniref:uncharacterized protein LOC130443724 isoform X2 n=1 Tax=Diorhabda sublineata TaxID=1163346 RepID=UPI0024E15B3B|nr:uncharacterized protein LOC130443724 isoform X2 [Diorhabda sublineata]XP_056634466.1 uncharacterized protein LOC130443724 isoform X2 [Diorhabda sublineata]